MSKNDDDGQQMMEIKKNNEEMYKGVERVAVNKRRTEEQLVCIILLNCGDRRVALI